MLILLFSMSMSEPCSKKVKKSGKIAPLAFPDFTQKELVDAKKYLKKVKYSKDEEEKLADEQFNIMLNDYLHSDRTSNTDWCMCGHCSNDPIVRQNYCCCEIALAPCLPDEKKKLVKVRAHFEAKRTSGKTLCIAHHPSFDVVMLDKEVLSVWIEEGRGDKAKGPMIEKLLISDKNRVFRYYAYRCFARWSFGHLSRGQRYEIPACVRTKIVKAFPSDGYTGFKRSDLVLTENVY